VAHLAHWRGMHSGCFTMLFPKCSFQCNMHTAGVEWRARAVVATYPAPAMRPGDLVNHAYATVLLCLVPDMCFEYRCYAIRVDFVLTKCAMVDVTSTERASQLHAWRIRLVTLCPSHPHSPPLIFLRHISECSVRSIATQAVFVLVLVLHATEVVMRRSCTTVAKGRQEQLHVRRITTGARRRSPSLRCELNSCAQGSDAQSCELLFDFNRTRTVRMVLWITVVLVQRSFQARRKLT
jgi:hypothetical protein